MVGAIGSQKQWTRAINALGARRIPWLVLGGLIAALTLPAGLAHAVTGKVTETVRPGKGFDLARPVRNKRQVGSVFRGYGRAVRDKYKNKIRLEQRVRKTKSRMGQAGSRIQSRKKRGSKTRSMAGRTGRFPPQFRSKGRTGRRLKSLSR